MKAPTPACASSLQADLQSYLTKRLSPLCDDSSVVELLYPEQLESLEDIFSRCVLHSESNSLLVMGPRGAGKSVLVKTALERLSRKSTAKGNYSVVKLFGNVHTDDRIALRDITLQLNLEIVVGDRVFGSFAENLQFLLDSLKSGGGADRSKAKSTIFVLDDFELFTQHRNQTLLYNLFDVAQSRQAPIAVIGLCSRLDAVELLEKRVKSRFAHRFLYLMNSFNESEYLAVAEALLSVDPAEFVDKSFAKKWNSNLRRTVMPAMKDSLMKLYHVDRIVRTLVRCLQPMVREIGELVELEPTLFRDTVNRLYDEDAKMIVISRMPALHIILLVCMLRLNVIYDGEPFNFELLYKEFKRFNRETRSLLNLPKDCVLKAFESVCELEFVQPVGGMAMASQKRYRLHHLHFSAELVRKAVESHSGLPTDVSQWVTTTLSDRSLGI